MSLDETPPPLPLPVKMFSDESLTTPEKRPRPFSYFVNKSGAALKALRDSMKSPPPPPPLFSCVLTCIT